MASQGRSAPSPVPVMARDAARPTRHSRSRAGQIDSGPSPRSGRPERHGHEAGCLRETPPPDRARRCPDGARRSCVSARPPPSYRAPIDAYTSDSMRPRGRPGSSPVGRVAAECAGGGLRRASRAISRFYEAAFAPLDLTATQFSILVAVQLAGSIPLSRLAEVPGARPHLLDRAVKPLVRRRCLRSPAGPDPSRADRGPHRDRSAGSWRTRFRSGSGSRASSSARSAPRPGPRSRRAFGRSFPHRQALETGTRGRPPLPLAAGPQPLLGPRGAKEDGLRWRTGC